MQHDSTTILLVEDNPGDARLLHEALADAGPFRFELTRCERLGDALKALAGDRFDVVFLDLSLPDSLGLDTFFRVHRAAPNVPIIVLTGSCDETLAVKAVKAGAQDYLVKGEVEARLLVRSMRYAIERHRMQEQLRNLSLSDELTGLYNRRGFLTFANQHLRVAFRSRRALSVVFVDLDGMKQINDTFGHAEGDMALIRTAEILRKTFRESDIIARIGGDEFAVITLDTDWNDVEVLCTRLQANLAAFNASVDHGYQLSLSFGVSHRDARYPCSADELLVLADKAMYEQKRSRAG
jgi:diguanylate cyclase (GGDEF)-like protein